LGGRSIDAPSLTLVAVVFAIGLIAAESAALVRHKEASLR
jgi:hypothetical protein